MWIPRDLEARLRRSARTRPVLVLTGARQTGKTSLLRRLFPEPGFVSLDLPSEAEQAEKEPEAFLRRHPPPVILDEVQYAPGLFRHLKAAVDAGRVTRFAIANPQHAPYGRAAREVLERLGLWQRLQPALVLGENASQAMQFAASGSCQGGIVPLSLASAPEIAKLGTFEPIPADWHSALRQRMVLVARAGRVASVFYDYLRRDTGVRETLARFGFGLPGEK